MKIKNCNFKIFNYKANLYVWKKHQHLWIKLDTITNDKEAVDIGQMVILPASYTGSPRHMQEYAQDALTFVRKYGCPDLLIMFTCN